MAKKESVDVVGIPDAKRWLRRYAIRSRQALSPSARRRASRSIVGHLVKSSYYRNANVIASFLSFGSEVLTDGLIERAWRDGKKVVIPIAAPDLKRPTFALFKRGDRLRQTSFGPMELVEKKAAFPFRSIDLVLVPGLAFDRAAHRLGYGGGIYDRMLVKASRARHVGLFYSAQFLPTLPRAAHDRRMDAIVTENGVQSGRWLSSK